MLAGLVHSEIPGLPFKEYVRGINYGGRFIPEHWMQLPGMQELYRGASPIDCSPEPCDLSLCDMAAQVTDAGERMLAYLNASIQLSHFEHIQRSGFNVVRLPLGYWNLARGYPVQAESNATRVRWNSLAGMLDPAQYLPYIERVMQYAQNTGLRVLLDLHGLPGGQSTNQYTGCSTACQSPWNPTCPSSEYSFADPLNLATGVEAVRVMAQICQAHRSACYGIELLNEPAPEPSVHNLQFRSVLLDFYKAAIETARSPSGGLDPDIPIVLMDFPWYMASYWNLEYAKLSTLPNAGTLLWETHIYAQPGKQVQSITELKYEVVGAQLALLDAFTLLHPDVKLFIGEYALDQLASTINLSEAAHIYYDVAITHRSLIGLSVWNYDGPGSWGAISPNPGSNPQNLTRSFWSTLNAQVPRM